MTRSTDNRWLSRYATLTAAVTLVLICVGGVVTSRGAGMSVPDWPTTYGYNMFFFPFSKWVGGIFYEHSHRLVASLVGLMTVALAVWLWMKEARAWLRWLGVAAVVLVVLQGVLGGLRVTALKDELGIFHATLAQMFFVLVSAVALFTSRWWREATPGRDGTGLRQVFAMATAMIVTQLVLGATMRHQHAGLAIPDFPAAYGKVWPAMDVESVARYNQLRSEVVAANPITAAQIGLQMAHRLGAVLILLVVLWAARASWRALGMGSPLTKLSLAWLALIVAQAALGAATIWTNKSADIATAHVGVGALTLVTGVLLTLAAYRCLVAAPSAVNALAQAGRSEREAELPA